MGSDERFDQIMELKIRAHSIIIRMNLPMPLISEPAKDNLSKMIAICFLSEGLILLILQT
jgi:hypothetical protein